jgi:hypothetical protein
MVGLLFDILDFVRSALGFEYTLVLPPKSGLIDDNPWVELVEMVGRNEVDFSMMDTTIMLSRLEVL